MRELLLKWIVCQVDARQRRAFSQAQEGWSGLAAVDGFLGQMGGWDRAGAGEACLLALWADGARYETFMERIHDRMLARTGQQATCETVSVALFQTMIDMPGREPDLLRALGSGSYLRVAECRVKPERVENFVEVQESVWIPAMSRAEGMLGGCFNRHASEPHFLVVSLWDSRHSHDNYARQKVPVLREQAGVAENLQAITGRFVELAPEWLVLPVTGAGD